MRFNKNEKLGCKKFAKNIAQLGDWYVNDAFGTCIEITLQHQKLLTFLMAKNVLTWLKKNY